jgi:hypothetical protein
MIITLQFEANISIDNLIFLLHMSKTPSTCSVLWQMPILRIRASEMIWTPCGSAIRFVVFAIVPLLRLIWRTWNQDM